MIPPLLQIALWAMFSGAGSMALYRFLSPQHQLVAIKTAQKNARQALLRHEGDWDELSALIKKDLGLSFRQIKLVFMPFLLSAAPLAALIYWLDSLYGGVAYLGFGPEWMRGFEFCYFIVLLLVSLIIKMTFKIA